MKLIFRMASDKVNAIDTLMRKVDLFDIEVQELQTLERN